MAERSILDMSDSEILELIARNDAARREATQEKQVAREKERKTREIKDKGKEATSAATDILKAYMENTGGKLTKEKATDAAADILKAYMNTNAKKDTKKK